MGNITSPAGESRRISWWKEVPLWVCALSLLIMLANRVPRFADGGTCWTRPVPSQMTAKVLAKDFFLLEPPRFEFVQQLRPARVRRAALPSPTTVVVPLENCLYNRPPPCVERESSVLAA